jgi:hypothetical protein
VRCKREIHRSIEGGSKSGWKISGDRTPSRTGTLYSFIVLICPGTFETLAKFLDALGNRAFNNDDFYVNMV